MLYKRGSAGDFLLVTCLDYGNKLNPFFAGLATIILAVGPEQIISLSGWEPTNPSAANNCLIVAGVVLMVISIGISTANAFYQKTRRNLETALEKANAKLGEVASNMPYLFEGLLINLWNRLGYKPERKARVSIYVHHEGPKSGEGYFTCRGRYSHHPELRKRRRTKYPVRQGYIWEGWTKDWYFDKDFPHGDDEYRTYNQEKYKIPASTLGAIRFKTECCAVKRLVDAESTNHGVIVVEGEKELLDEDALKEVLEQLAPDYAHMIKTLREHIADPKDAREREL